MNFRLKLIKHTVLTILSMAIHIESTQAAPTPALKRISEVIKPAGTYNENKFWKVAVVQWNPPSAVPIGVTKIKAESTKKIHREMMEKYIREAAAEKAKYIVLSEFAVTGYPNIPELSSEDDNFRDRTDIKPYVELIPGPSTKFFSQLAQELGVWIQFGLAEVDKESDIYYNSAVVIDDKGEIAASYRKQELFKVEVNYVSPGNKNVTFKTPAGVFGLLICADVYNYSVLGRYKNSKVDVLSLSTSWAEQNTGMKYFKEAAQYTGSYLLAANQNYFPDSGVIDPTGKTQSHIRQSEDTIAYGYLPLK